MIASSGTLAERCAAGQIQGAREEQQDDYGVIDAPDLTPDGTEHMVLVVADGMGGHQGGAAASRTVVRAFVRSYEAEQGPVVERLRGALQAANAAIAEETAQAPKFEGMGATLVAGAITKHGLEWISVGDSMLMLLRNGKLSRLNADHSMTPILADLVESSRMTAADFDAEPERSALRSALTGEPLRLIDVSSQPVPLEPGDCVVLASDGLASLSNRAIATAILDSRAGGLQAAVDRLLALIVDERRPGQDNATVLLYSPRTALGSPLVEVTVLETAPEPRPKPEPLHRIAARWWVGAAIVALAAVLLALWLLDPGGTDSGSAETQSAERSGVESTLDDAASGAADAAETDASPDDEDSTETEDED